MKRFYLLLFLVVSFSAPVLAQPEPARVDQLEGRVSVLEGKIRSFGGEGVAVFLCGAFCALWAQNTGRNAWLWFFLGLLFSVITLLFLLSKNSYDRSDGRGPDKRKFDLNDFRQQ